MKNKERYLNLIHEFLPRVFNDIKEEILSEPEILNFVDDKKQLEELIENQSQLLMEYFLKFPNASEVNMSKINKFYENLNIPYIVIAKNIDMIKNKILERVALEKELDNKELLFTIKEYVDKLRNKVAYIYLKKDIKKLRDINAKTFRKYLLYKANLNFIEAIITAIENDDLNSFPLERAEECEFHEYLHYPESIMACMDANLCSYIEDLHKLIHKVSNSLFMFLLKNKMADAYMAFKELSESVLKLSKTLAELYFTAFSDAEINFFKLLEYITEAEGNKFVFIIDIQNLKALNKIYSEKKINLMLKQIQDKLYDYVNPRRKNLLLVRGLTANFYMFAMDIQKKDVFNLVETIKNIIEHTPIEIGEEKIKVSIGVLELDKKFEIPKEELIKILLHIKDLAKKEEKNTKVIIKDEEKENLVNWINKRYQDIKFIKNKISSKEIDLVFQPIFDIKRNEIYSLEALARIKNDNGTLIPAGVFIDLIYQYDLIYNLDILVLEKLIEKKQFLNKITNKIFLNISSETIIKNEFFDIWKDFIKQMEGFNIILEITEQKLVEDLSLIISMDKSNTFLSFAIDDFGSGYSSLKTVVDMVKEGILHVLKIDGSLVKEITNNHFSEKIVKTISSMVQNLEIEAVAEFIEDNETLTKLKQMNIKYGQGYYLTKPKTLEELLIMQLNH